MGAGALRAAAGLIDALRVRWADQPDERLLAAYARDRDPHALAALVARHGPAVWAVCRRLLRCPHDAEDAFQTTFLALVRGAPTLRATGTVGGWLYGVAVRTAAKSRAATRL
ncbi:MAG: sigma-70 family RNA polymerase sigma factor, partial [Gemmataceae bacterium]